jgi:NADH-quinone oxidoreductase subunit C
MTNEFVLETIKEHFAEGILHTEESFGMLNITVTKDLVLPMLHFLNKDERLGFNFLTDLCGIHYPDNKGAELGVIYHVHNLSLIHI